MTMTLKKMKLQNDVDDDNKDVDDDDIMIV